MKNSPKSFKVVTVSIDNYSEKGKTTLSKRIFYPNDIDAKTLARYKSLAIDKLVSIRDQKGRLR